MKSHLKTYTTVVTNTVDSETGELLHSDIKKHKYMVDTKEQFYLVYSSLLGVFNDCSLPAIKTYAYILQNYKPVVMFEMGIATREAIGEHCNLSSGTIANALTELKEKNLLFSPRRGCFIINPRYAFQGSTLDRNNALKATIELGCKDC
jgi:hypothetical protein